MSEEEDDVQGLANQIGHNLYISTNGTVSISPSSTIAENIRTEDNINTVTGGNCGQDPESVPEK